MKVQGCMRDSGGEIRATHQISMKIVAQNENIQAELRTGPARAIEFEGC